SGSEDKTVRLWEVETGKELKRFEGHTGPVSAVVFTPNGKVLSGGHDKTLRLWDPDTGEELLRLDGHTDKVNSIDVYSDWVASGGNDRTVRLWEPRGAEAEVVKNSVVLEGHQTAVIRVAFVERATFDKLLSAGSQYQKADKFLRLWQWRPSAKPLAEFGGEG